MKHTADRENRVFSRIGLCMGLMLLFCCLGVSGAWAAGKLTLPASLLEIADEAFMNDASITSVEIPFGAERIGARAFAGCGNLQEIIIPATVREIDEDAFSGCDELTILCRSGSVAETYAIEQEIAYSIYENTQIPKGLEYSIVNNKYAQITNYTGNATRLILPDEIEGIPVHSIAAGAFRSCDKLVSIALPSSLKYISSYAFAYCTSLTSIQIPDSVESLYSSAFRGCTSLEKVNYPKNWSSGCYDDSPFIDCTALTSIIIPEGVTSIPKYAFANSSISSVIFPSTLTDIGAYAFENTPLVSLVIPEGVTSIYNDAFSNCTNLTSVVLPDSLNVLEFNAFLNCTALSRLSYPVNGASSNSQESPFEGCTSLTHITIPVGTTSIPAYAFRNTSISSVSLPSTLISIGTFAFAETPLTSISIPDGVTSLISYAFSSCKNLKAVYLPRSITKINTYAFYESPNLTTIYGEAGSYAETYAEEKGYSFSQANKPNVTLDVSADGNIVGDRLVVTTNVDHDSEDYVFSYELYVDGKLTRQTDYIGDVMCTFPTYKPGSYQVIVNAKDCIGTIGTASSEIFQFADAAYAEISGRVLNQSGQPLSNTEVTVTRQFSSDSVKLLTDANGIWRWDEAVCDESYTISYIKEGVVFDEESIDITVDSIWGVVMPPVYGVSLEDEKQNRQILISGTILTAEGKPAVGIYVSLKNVNGALVDTATTDTMGDWSFYVPAQEDTYTVTYDQSMATIAPEKHNISIADEDIILSAVADITIGAITKEVAFTMTESSIMVGDSVQFELSLSESIEKLRLVVDETPYDVIYPEGNSFTFTRTFTRDGERRIAFQIYENGYWGDISEAQKLTVVSNGVLDVPVYNDIVSHYAGDELIVDWADIENAEEYVVRVYCNQIAQILLHTTESKITIPSTVFPAAGQYSVSVMATGFGYSQSGADDLFEVILRDYQMAMSSPSTGNSYMVGDHIDVNLTQSGGGYLAVKVVCPDGKAQYYPLTDSRTTTEDRVWFSVAASQVGTYAITPYIYVNDVVPEMSIPAITGDTVYVQVIGPDIREIKPGNGNYTWVSVGTAQNFTITTNNLVDQIDIYEGNTRLFTSSTYEEDAVTHVRTFELVSDIVPEKGKHSYIIRGTDNDAKVSCKEQKEFYVVEYEDYGRKVFAQADIITLYSSPLNGKSVASVNGSTNIEPLTVIGDAGTWYYVETKTGTKGFAPYEQLSDQAWENASGKIEIVYPAQGSSVPLSGEALTIKWNVGLVKPEGSYLSLKLQGLVGDSNISAGVAGSSYDVLMTDLEEDSYSLQISLKKDGVTLAESETITFNVGNFSLDDSYKDWWKKSLLGNYNVCVDMGDKFLFTYLSGNTTYLNRPLMIREPATLAYTKLMEDQKDINHDAKYNSESNWYLMSDDERSRKALLTISKSMMNEIGKNNLILKADLSNASTVAQSSQTAATNKATAELITNSIEGVMNGVKVYITVQSGGNKLTQNVFSLVDLVFDAVSAAAKSFIDENSVVKQLNAYADQYVASMQQACDLYVEYLEETYKDELAITGNSIYKTYVEQYISAFKQIKSDPDSLREVAVKQILSSSGYTMEQLEALDNGMNNDVLSMVNDDLIYELIVQSFDAAAQIAGSQMGIPLDMEFVSYEDGKLEINWSQLSATAGQTILTVLVRTDFKNEVHAAIQLSLDDKFHGTARQLRALAGNKNAAMKQINVIAVFSTVLDLAENIINVVDSGKELIDQSNNKGMYDVYGQMLMEALNCHKDVVCVSGLSYGMTDQHIASMDTQELEYRRKAMVSLMNFDINLMTYYRNMRTINDQNGFKFNNDIDWLELEQIDARIEYFMRVRDLFKELPDVYKSLVQ